MQTQKGQVQLLLHDHGGFDGVLGFTPLLWERLLLVLKAGIAALLVLYF